MIPLWGIHRDYPPGWNPWGSKFGGGAWGEKGMGVRPPKGGGGGNVTAPPKVVAAIALKRIVMFTAIGRVVGATCPRSIARRATIEPSNGTPTPSVPGVQSVASAAKVHTKARG